MTHPSPKLRLALLAAALLAAAPAARAGCRISGCAFVLAGNSAFSVVSMHEMEGGRWVVEAAPSFWTMSTGEKTGGGDANIDVSPKGFGGAFAVKREFSERWGIGVFGSAARQSGTETITGPLTFAQAIKFPTPGVPGGTISNMRGSMVGVMLTRDFRPKRDGFRLPVTLGLMQASYRQDFSNSGGGATESMTIEQSDLGFMGTISFDFLVGEKLRIMPGGGVVHGGSFLRAQTYTRTGAGATQITQDIRSTLAAPNLWVSFLYRPWNLAFDWNITELVFQDKVLSATVYSLKLARKFG